MQMLKPTRLPQRPGAREHEPPAAQLGAAAHEAARQLLDRHLAEGPAQHRLGRARRGSGEWRGTV